MPIHFEELMDPRILQLSRADLFFEDSNWLIERKISGRRLQVKAENNQISFAGRYSDISNENSNDLRLKLNHLTHPFLDLKADFLVDGEVFSRGSYSRTMSILNSHVDDAIDIQQEHGFLQFVAFDLIWLEGKKIGHDPLLLRQQRLRKLIQANEFIHVIEQGPLDLKSRKKMWDDTINNGHEGIVFKLNESQYENGRSKWWRKLKVSSSFDGVIMGFTKSEKFPNDFVTALHVGQYQNGTLVHVANVGNLTRSDQANFCSNQKQLLGKVVQFRADSRTENSYKNPRFECIRNDKKPETCIWEGEE